MGALKNAFHDEICAAADDQRADEFDCYDARLHSLLSDLDWLDRQFIGTKWTVVKMTTEPVRQIIKDMMK